MLSSELGKGSHTARRIPCVRTESRIALLSITGLLLGAALALAEDESPAVALPGSANSASENPGKCEEARAKHAAFCEENPEKCEQMKQKRAERREWCKQNPEKCEQQRAEMKQRRAEMQAKCEADPAKCERDEAADARAAAAPDAAAAPARAQPAQPAD